MKVNTILTNVALLVALMTMMCQVQGQVELVPLGSNQVIMQHAKKINRDTKGSAEAVKLPFWDDFSNYTGYPNPALWKDRMGYVNTGFAINPPTIGVVTLDAIGADGKIYAHAEASTFGADTLTSQFIRLDTNFTAVPVRTMNIGDSLYFSFYYQPAGGSVSNPPVAWERIGNQPEVNDSLVLEFGYETGDTIFIDYSYCLYVLDSTYKPGDTLLNPFMPGYIYIFETNMFPGAELMLPCDSIMGPETVWNHVWSTPGCSLDSWLQNNSLEYFKHVLIPIVDPQYLRNNFQFRFRNYASLGDQDLTVWKANVDQWNIDYVRLDRNRRYDDRYPNDVAFVEPSASIIAQYREMPWNQYDTSYLVQRGANKLVNLSNSTRNTLYSYTVYKNGIQLVTYPSNSENAYSYYPSGFVTTQAHVKPPIKSIFTIFPDGSDSAVVTLVHNFKITGSSVGDFNDTCVQTLRFYNYYAYDDGTAESGLTINSTSPNPHIYLASGFLLSHPDTLRSVRMWFNPVLNNTDNLPFTLVAWNDHNGEPGTIIASKEQLYPNHADDYETFIDYYFDDPVPISGKFYVGFYLNHSNQFSLGFDQNSDARGTFFTKIGNIWNEEFIYGAPMIRPVVGKYFDHGLSIAETPPSKEIKCYPNPTQDMLYIDIPEIYKFNSQITLLNLFGQKLTEYPVNNTRETISLSRYAAGIYFIRFTHNHQLVGQSKIIKVQ